MANLAGGGGGGGGRGGEGDVPDIRMALGLPRVKVGNRSENWLNNNPNSPLNRDMTIDEKELMFVNFLKALNFGKDELTVGFRPSDHLRRQPDNINAFNDNACVIIGAMFRKRRLCLFKMVMLFWLSQALKIAKGSQDLVPEHFKDPAQLRGGIKACQEEMTALKDQLLRVIAQIEDAGGEAVMLPDVFSKPYELPKPSVGAPKGKK